MIYQGGCHCGKISFEVEGEFDSVMECNCSICSQKGSLLWFVERSKLKLLTPEDTLSTYTFNTHNIKHRFCSHCGCGPFAEAIHPATQKPTAAINVRSLRNIDLTAIKRQPFDGKSL